MGWEVETREREGKKEGREEVGKAKGLVSTDCLVEWWGEEGEEGEGRAWEEREGREGLVDWVGVVRAGAAVEH